MLCIGGLIRCFLLIANFWISHACPVGYAGSPCTPRRCEPLITPQNAMISGGACSSQYLSVCKMACRFGFAPSGSTERQCVVDAASNVMVWSGSPLLCRVRQCDPLSAPANGYIVGGVCSSHLLSVCRMECNKGYEVVGSWRRECIAVPVSDIMMWSGTPMTCQVRQCEPLFAPADGFIVGGVCSSHLSSVCQMECNKGYEVVGSSRRECIADPVSNIMMWSGTPMTCQVRQCEPLSAPADGFIVGGVCSSHLSSVCQMECNKGYEVVGSSRRECIADPVSNIMMWSGTPMTCQG
ncbi:P-selectin-like isoform X2 [Stylophora pistillata]|uniref:P-selectin-like isoform X2 n=1 Tax=Stylophora pistillata TaxID=50429 RepID=UPI000C03EB6C|nr:P-selectin-like isoform X2 [Stylophora pistillata]